MRLLTISFLAVLAVPVLGGEEGPPVAARVDAAMGDCLADGPHRDRCAPLVAVGPVAVAPLAAVLGDGAAAADQRILAAQALGRLGTPAARDALRAAAEAADPALRDVAEESLWLLGDTDAVDARIERLLTKYGSIPIARAGARQRLARIYVATGRFASAARVWREVVNATKDEEQRRFLAYDLACYEALAGRRDAAMAAAREAMRAKRTDLDWMARDGDLRCLRDDPEFLALLAATKSERGAKSEPAPEPTPEETEYRKLSRAYWDGDFEKYIEASNRYWEGYRDWLESEGRENGDEAVAAWKERRGPEPVDPTPGWIERFRGELTKREGTALAPRIRDELLTIYGNEEMAEDWIALFAEIAAKTPEHESLGENAHSALYFADRTGRSEEVLAALGSVLEAHPRAPSGAGIRLALAMERRVGNDDAAARALYAQVIEIYPDSFQAEEAKGELYEMDRLAQGRTAPDFETTDIRGRPIRLADYRGKVVLLDFWATWCGPCLGELPNVKKLWAKFGGRDDFVMIGVSLDADGIALVDFLEEEGIGWPQVCELGQFDDPLPRLYNARGIPDTCLIDREGKIVWRSLRGEDLHEAVRKALGKGE